MAAITGSAAKSAEQVLYTFQGGTDGAGPAGALISDAAGNLYGVTADDGGQPCECGTVFKLAPDGSETILHSFAGGADGALPQGALVLDAAGNLFGTTTSGGRSKKNCGCGTVFKITPGGAESVLYTFKGGPDGTGPIGNLVLDKKGDLYGVTIDGGKMTECQNLGCGTVFKLKPTGKKTVLYVFQGGSDGASPTDGLITDKAGNLYGTTVGGGGASNCTEGCGTVFKVAKNGTESVLYAFLGGTSDGEQPNAGVTIDNSGNLYGTTTYGGSADEGTVYELTASGTEMVLHSFSGSDGSFPFAGLILDNAGNLYGATTYGGSGTSCLGGPPGCGVVFQLAPGGTETVLYAFTGGADGGMLGASLLAGTGGLLYGTAGGGTDSDGVVFSVPE